MLFTSLGIGSNDSSRHSTAAQRDVASLCLYICCHHFLYISILCWRASARTNQLEASSNAHEKNRCGGVVVYQRHSHTHTRAAFASKHHRTPLLEAPLAWCAVRSHKSDPTSSGQIVATVNQGCGELFSIARLLRARERAWYASMPLCEDRTSVRGPQTDNPSRVSIWSLSQVGVIPS